MTYTYTFLIYAMTKFSLFYMYRPISHFIIMFTQYILLDSIYPVRGTVMDKTDHWRKGLQVLQSLTSLTAIFRNVCKLSDRNCLPILIFVNLYKISGWWGRSPSITSCMCVCVIAPRIRGRPAVRPSLKLICFRCRSWRQHNFHTPSWRTLWPGVKG